MEKAFNIGANLVHEWKLHGHGLVPLVKHIADYLSIKAHIMDSATIDAISKNDAIIFMQNNFNSASVKLHLKTYPHKYILFNIVSQPEQADFCMPMIQTRDELENIVKTKMLANMDDFDNIEAITFPFPFSRLFRIKKRLRDEKPIMTKRIKQNNTVKEQSESLLRAAINSLSNTPGHDEKNSPPPEDNEDDADSDSESNWGSYSSYPSDSSTSPNGRDAFFLRD